jgi:uncharacterized protein (TIRG00374 family)
MVLLAAAIYIILPQFNALDHSVQVIREMTLWAVGLAILAQILSYAGSGYLLQKLVATGDQQLSILTGMLVTLAASSVGLIAGGMVGNAAATYRWLHARGVDKEGALLASWLPPFFNNAILAVIGFIGVTHLIAVHELSTLQAIGFGFTLLTLGGLLGVVLWGLYHRLQFTAMLVQIDRRWTALRRHQYHAAVTQATTERIFHAWDVMYAGGCQGPALGALLNTSFDILTLYMLFIAAGHAVSLGVLLTGYGLPLLLSKVTFLPGGVGIVEGTMALLYRGLGVPEAVTVVVVLAYRALSFWIPTLVGFPIAVFLQRSAPNTSR